MGMLTLIVALLVDVSAARFSAVIGICRQTKT